MQALATGLAPAMRLCAPPRGPASIRRWTQRQRVAPSSPASSTCQAISKLGPEATTGGALPSQPTAFQAGAAAAGVILVPRARSAPLGPSWEAQSGDAPVPAGARALTTATTTTTSSRQGQLAQPQQDQDHGGTAAALLQQGSAGSSQQGRQHVHTVFAALFTYLALLAAAVTNPDWYMDLGAAGALWGGLWLLCARLGPPSPRTVALLALLPVMHLSGSLGLYSWELGNLSWDVLVHITNGCLGTLLLAAAAEDLRGAATAAHENQQRQQLHAAAATDGASHGGARAALLAADGGDAGGAAAGGGASEATGSGGAAAATAAGWRGRAWGVVQLSCALLLGTSLVEVVEAAGGQLAGHAGEGIFLRGPGDLCTASLPCSPEVDTMKDMVDNMAGMCLGLVALATRGGQPGSSGQPGSTTSAPGGT